MVFCRIFSCLVEMGGGGGVVVCCVLPFWKKIIMVGNNVLIVLKSMDVIITQGPPTHEDH